MADINTHSYVSRQEFDQLSSRMENVEHILDNQDAGMRQLIKEIRDQLAEIKEMFIAFLSKND